MCTRMHIKQLHTSHHTKSRLACAPQTHTSPGVTASVLIYRHCRASLCHLVVVSDQLEVFRQRVCVCVCNVCSNKGLVHTGDSASEVKLADTHLSLLVYEPHRLFSPEKTGLMRSHTLLMRWHPLSWHCGSHVPVFVLYATLRVSWGNSWKHNNTSRLFFCTKD